MNRDIFADGNYDQDFVENRWTEENKSDKYPSAQAYAFSFTQQANDFFVEDGSFIRIQNLQIGYTTKFSLFLHDEGLHLCAEAIFIFPIQWFYT
jgi:TonB-dependent starch-binding outer membrane protein SusC